LWKLTAARGELLAWLNDLLAPQVVQKVEECGKGVILCQVSST
jgi:RP/EB family microtubule-associated protein